MMRNGTMDGSRIISLAHNSEFPCKQVNNKNTRLLVSQARTKILTHSDFLSRCLRQIVVDRRRKSIRILGRSRAITNRASRTRTHKDAISRFSVL